MARIGACGYTFGLIVAVLSVNIDGSVYFPVHSLPSIFSLPTPASKSANTGVATSTSDDAGAHADAVKIGRPTSQTRRSVSPLLCLRRRQQRKEVPRKRQVAKKLS